MSWDLEKRAVGKFVKVGQNKVALKYSALKTPRQAQTIYEFLLNFPNISVF